MAMDGPELLARGGCRLPGDAATVWLLTVPLSPWQFQIGELANTLTSKLEFLGINRQSISNFHMLLLQTEVTKPSSCALAFVPHGSPPVRAVTCSVLPEPHGLASCRAHPWA